jgi:hypothetical protein
MQMHGGLPTLWALYQLSHGQLVVDEEPWRGAISQTR